MTKDNDDDDNKDENGADEDVQGKARIVNLSPKKIQLQLTKLTEMQLSKFHQHNLKTLENLSREKKNEDSRIPCV